MPPPVVGQVPTGIELINYVAECLELGCDPDDVRKQLQTFGHAPGIAEKIVADTIAWREKNPGAGKSAASDSKPGAWNGTMVLGLIILAISVAVTGGTYFLASRSGGTYIVATGAIITGVLMFLRGAAQAGAEMTASKSQDSRAQDPPR
jgi:hypothetical protein